MCGHVSFLGTKVTVSHLNHINVGLFCILILSGCEGGGNLQIFGLVFCKILSSDPSS